MQREIRRFFFFFLPPLIDREKVGSACKTQLADPPNDLVIFWTGSAQRGRERNAQPKHQKGILKAFLINGYFEHYGGEGKGIAERAGFSSERFRGLSEATPSHAMRFLWLIQMSNSNAAFAAFQVPVQRQPPRTPSLHTMVVWVAWQ